MTRQFRSGFGVPIKVPCLLKELLMILIRQIDTDREPEKAVLWLIEMMAMRGVPPRKTDKNQENLEKK